MRTTLLSLLTILCLMLAVAPAMADTLIPTVPPTAPPTLGPSTLASPSPIRIPFDLLVCVVDDFTLFTGIPRPPIFLTTVDMALGRTSLGAD